MQLNAKLAINFTSVKLKTLLNNDFFNICQPSDVNMILLLVNILTAKIIQLRI